MNNQAIGIYGGTFDPIHLGHTVPVKDLAAQLNLDAVYLLPAHIPPHKNSTTANALQRKLMVEKVCHVEPLFTLDDRELNRTTPSYTIDTIKELNNQYPDHTLYFFIGTDSLLQLTSWHKIAELLTLCHFVVTSRPGYDISQLNQPLLNNRLTRNKKDLLLSRAGKIFIGETKQVNISSTELRTRLRSPLNRQNSTNNCRPYLLADVYNYILQNKLYID
ncbi:nicotinate-nucleotide adenylyltransferase [Colwelliaceae bacterium BS250]